MKAHQSAVKSDLTIENLSRLENRQSIMFTSSNLREGTTSALISTAKVLVDYLDARILIIDGNMKQPGLHHHLSVPLSPGLSDAISDPAISIMDLIYKDFPWAHVITRGEKDLNGGKGLTSARFQSIFETLKKNYDYILFDMGPVNLFPALHHIMALMDGVVLVVACESTRWEVAQNVKNKLESAGADILGVILNKRKFYIPKWLYKYV